MIGPKGAVWVALLLSAVLFGLLHLGSPGANLISTTVITLIGILFGISYVLTGRLALATGLHFAWNLFQGNVFGFPVSGMTFPAGTVSVLSIEQHGPLLWSGGAFGPEGGFLGLLAVIVGLALSLAWIRARQGSLRPYVGIAEAPSEQITQQRPTAE